MKIERIELRLIRMVPVSPFVTSLGRECGGRNAILLFRDRGDSLAHSDRIPDAIDSREGYSQHWRRDRLLYQSQGAYDGQSRDLGYEDIYDHSKLQRELKTPICLDTSIHSLDDTHAAVELGSCRVINSKPSRVRGFPESKLIHDYSASMNILVWHGGMLESGIGK